ncbi:type VI secretion system baseplate subunit TssG [Vibrio sp. ZSDE26]|uniref:Type VI secretion system baseplate subunit TssG n=1 Tax=Vibrio amylolyticus TaxID=2847292 RepID=A0A9X1XNF3_9VIBR|nr:type VI secretion system baseplate subunit TssG [Vibrio amylolyticus]MCK6265158.1 type VI secretion system baseplate subunit TssG [Vibrio amylolyticus]
MSLIRDLSQQPQEWEFAQAMRQLSQFVLNQPNKIRLELKAEVMPAGDSSDIQYFSLKNNVAKLRLTKSALAGVQGVIPNYLYEELLAALHREDHALKDFLDVMNQRHYEILYRVTMKQSLLLDQEISVKRSELLYQLANLSKKHHHYFQYCTLLNQNSRHLPTLAKMLTDFFPYRFQVKTRPSVRQKLPIDSLTRLGTEQHFNSRLGQGFLLGKTCHAQFSRIDIFILMDNENEYRQTVNDSNLALKVRELSQHYLRDSTPISIYLSVQRAFLAQPMLTSNFANSARLGEATCLAPERYPAETVNILLNS